MNLVFRFMGSPLFAPLTTDDSLSLTQLAVASLNVTFAVINHFHGSLGSTMTKSTSSSNLSDNEYQMGVVIVAQSIWAQKQVIRIIKENTGLPQWVCRKIPSELSECTCCING